MILQNVTNYFCLGYLTLKIKLLWSFKMMGTGNYNSYNTAFNIPEHFKLQQHCYENLKSWMCHHLMLLTSLTTNNGRWLYEVIQFTNYILQMPVQLFNIILLIKHSCHVIMIQIIFWRFTTLVTRPQVQWEIYYTLLRVQIFLLQSEMQPKWWCKVTRLTMHFVSENDTMIHIILPISLPQQSDTC